MILVVFDHAIDMSLTEFGRVGLALKRIRPLVIDCLAAAGRDRCTDFSVSFWLFHSLCRKWREIPSRIGLSRLVCGT